ncbi:hypothetical protein CLV62_10299 [Dysgonomonas alginatilytica]|uniref:Uncharacterized protein n=1 Tax=Dysgonomonas alginatilytica TaxID=1605892 RepID=A0A2V3PVF1_9BACT|nr:hypothetical protein [Dysgonomonas alginatilytica]PXV68068.1 hypothetical protein CLV62_10299 [Dysgonomonas alginatilytica]
MKKLILLIFLSYSIFSFSQNSEIEKLVNVAYKTIVPKNFKYYNLIDSSFILDLKRTISCNPQLEKFIQANPDFKLSEFLSSSNSLDRISWYNYKIEGANLYSYNDIPKFATHLQIVNLIPFKTSKSVLDSLNHNKKHNEVIVPVKRWWSKSRIEKETKKKWDERDESTILENKKYFKFSTPIFSLDFRYAIIELITGGETSTTYVFKKVDNNWIPFSVIDGYVH